MADDSSPREVVHRWWESIVPTLIRTAAYLWATSYVIDRSLPRDAIQPALARSMPPGLPGMIMDYGLGPLMPVLVAFLFVSLLYAFDRLLGLLGRLAGAQLAWSGSFILWSRDEDGRSAYARLWYALPH